MLEEQAPEQMTPHQLREENYRYKHMYAPMLPDSLGGRRPYKSQNEATDSTGYHIMWQNMLGKGGFGAVYKCYRKDERNRVSYYAIKVIDRQIDPVTQPRGQTIKQLVNEINNWDHCNGNPYIVKLVAHFAVMNQYHFVMEFAEGGDFVSELKRQPSGRFTDAGARYYFRQMVQGINYMHARCIAHRDVKLDNFLLATDPRDASKKICKIIDFGLSAVAWTHKQGPLLQNNTCGTFRYMPPEILFARKGMPLPFLHQPTKSANEISQTPHDPPHVPNAYQRWILNQETPNPVSIVKVHQYYTMNRIGTFGVDNDSWALGVSLFVMLTGSYPFWIYNLPHGLDVIMKGRFMKCKFMTTLSRTFIRTMLEPNPRCRAKTRNILYHDWMIENPPSRSKRRSVPADHDTVFGSTPMSDFKTPPESMSVPKSGERLEDSSELYDKWLKDQNPPKAGPSGMQGFARSPTQEMSGVDDFMEARRRRRARTPTDTTVSQEGVRVSGEASESQSSGHAYQTASEASVARQASPPPARRARAGAIVQETSSNGHKDPGH